MAHFLESRQIGRFSTQHPNVTATLFEDQSVSIVAFHLSVANLTDKTKDPQSHKPSSKMEERRLLRAFTASSYAVTSVERAATEHSEAID